MPGFTYPPTSLLAEILGRRDYPPELILITGPIGAGKSTWCASLVEEARANDVRVGGLLSPSVVADEGKVGIDLLDIATGERRRLASPRSEEASSAPTTKCWQFEPETLAWGNRVLRDLPPGDLVILDELGPLELTRDEGLQEGVRLIDARRFSVACVVVRPELLSHAQARWPWVSRVIEVTRITED